MRKLLSTLIFLSVFVVFPQQEASNWYFGNNAGINFDVDTGAVTSLSGGSLVTVEGCTTISDVSGNLVLYTDGQTVYNANHQAMANGFGLLGDESSSQSAIVVPKPGSTTIYYIFTVGSNQNETGLNYSEVDISLNGGLGNVTANKNISLLTKCSEKISAVLKDCTTGNIWVITLSNANGNSTSFMNSFHAFEVSNAGVDTSAVISVLTGFTTADSRGNLKFSPSGNKLACANASSGLFIADFDAQTGVVSNPENLSISTQNNIKPYGVEFSPNSQLLYVTASNDYFNQTDPSLNNIPANHSSSLIQYDLSANNISSSQVVIDQRQLYRGGLQLGPNGKIYRALSATYLEGIPNLGVIENPNTLGTGCNYVHAAVSLSGNLSRQGLPPFIQSFFSQQIDIIQNGVSALDLFLCLGDTYTLIAEDNVNSTYTWYMDNVLLPETDFDLEINQAGEYKVEIITSDGNCGTTEGIAIVSYFDIPTATQPGDLIACDDDHDGISEFDLSSQLTSILNGQDSNEFNIKYFTSMADAIEGTSTIPELYENISNPQTIYARVENDGFNDCFEITSFNLTVFNTPQIPNTITLNTCDNDTDITDGFTTINLSNINPEVLGTQNPNLFSISFHNSQNAADNNTGLLPNIYNNLIAFTETIYIRVENIQNPECYVTNSLTLNINPLPEAFNSHLYQCDDSTVIDGFTTFNLNEANNILTGNIDNLSTLFYSSLANAQNDTNPIDGNAYNNLSNPQIIYVRVTDDLTGCTSFSELTIEVSTTQINDYVAIPVCDGLDSEDGIHTFNLNDFSTEILNGLPVGISINYYETFNDALLEQNELSSTYNNTTLYSQTIYARGESDNACYGINEVLLTIDPLPALENDETVFYCLNDYPVTNTIEAGLTNGDSSDYSFSWSNGFNSETILINEIGNYTVTVTNNSTQCQKSRTITVLPSNIATIENIEVIDGTLGSNQITVITTGEGDYQYALIDEDGNTTPYQDSNILSHISPGVYTISIRDIKNNCGIVEQTIYIIGFPLFFTPNGDTFNDTWQVYAVSESFEKNAEIHIFDRYGKLITQLKASSKGWDGTLKGKPLPQSDYWFSVTLENGEVYKNHFTLKR